MTRMEMAWNAPDYAQNSSAQYGWAQALLERLALTGTEDVLDIGCGDGRVTAELAGLVSGRVVGIDNAVQMVELAHRRHGRANLLFRQMDARRLVFRQEFDRVFSNAVLHWIEDHRAILAGITRALKPSGRLVLSMGGRGNVADFMPIVDEVIRRPQWRDWFTDFVFPYAFYGTEEYAQWLPEAGLQATRIELVPKDMMHADMTALKGWIRTTWLPYTGRVPSQQRERFIDELVGAYLRQYPVDAFGRTHVKMVRLEVEAEKRQRDK